ncbi:hypothetical protein [Luteolibacter sp. LG18]|uniref:hypothetical protein n=1 Tax=Luteolibacter sp. LG18 TaxID=2819286 RepID=UPI002B2C0F04|nr:hypothetical protein llg_06560 [Luteolibacter sp. LG18]
MKSLLLALALVTPVLAADSGTPAEAAVRFVEKLRGGQVDLAPGADTALSAATGKDKREMIAARIKRLSREISADRVEVGPVKQDGDLAAVLVRQAAGFDPGSLRVIAIGLVRKGDQWLPAPVPGSFENTSLGYDESRAGRIAALEAWMTREQVVDLSTLRDQSAERLHKEIGGKIQKEVLQKEKPPELVKRLLTACATRDQATMLGLIGGLQKDLPRDWSERLGAVGRAFSKETFEPAWRLLAAPGVIRSVVLEDGDDQHAAITMACLDASAESGRGTLPHIRLLSLDLEKDPEGLWRIDLPAALLRSDPPDPHGDEDGIVGTDYLDALPAVWRRQFPLAKLDTAKAASEAVVAALRANTPDSLLTLLDLEGDPEQARLGASRLALIWRDLHSPRDLTTLLPIGFIEKNDGAVASYQVFSSRQPERADLRMLYFVKRNGGWHLIPGLRPGDQVQPELAEVKAQADTVAPDWTKDWEDLALADSPALDSVPGGEGPPEEATRGIFNEWSKAIVAGDIGTSIRLTAHLKRDRGTARLLRNLGYELTGALKTGGHATILGVIRRGPWTAISARIGNAADPAATYPLYPLVATPDGPRVMAEIDLFANGNRTRDFLNVAAWSRLEAGGNTDAAAQLREIYEIHRKNAESDRPPIPEK